MIIIFIFLAVQHERAPRTNNNIHQINNNNNNNNNNISPTMAPPHLTTDTPDLHSQMMGGYMSPHDHHQQNNYMANTGPDQRNFIGGGNNNFTTSGSGNQYHHSMYPPSHHSSNFSPPYTPDDELSPVDRKNAGSGGFLNIASLIQLQQNQQQNNGIENNNTELPDHLHDVPDATNSSFMSDKQLNNLDNITNESLIPNINEFPATTAAGGGGGGGGTNTSQNFINPEKIYESSVRILYMSVSWARSIPTFVELPFTDQALLLEACWSELFILCMIQCSVPMDLSVLLSAAGAHAEKESSQNVPGSVQDLRTLQHIVQRFQNLAIDATEFACLKATVLFKPGMYLETLGTVIIKSRDMIGFFSLGGRDQI